VTDDLGDTVDYGSLCAVVAGAVSGGHVVLLEHLGARIGDAVLAADPRIDAVTVWLRKLRPPVAHDLATSGVRLTRRRGDQGGGG
jgi:dihydroneopterin aldolase